MARIAVISLFLLLSLGCAPKAVREIEDDLRLFSGRIESIIANHPGDALDLHYDISLEADACPGRYEDRHNIGYGVTYNAAESVFSPRYLRDREAMMYCVERGDEYFKSWERTSDLKDLAVASYCYGLAYAYKRDMEGDVILALLREKERLEEDILKIYRNSLCLSSISEACAQMSVLAKDDKERKELADKIDELKAAIHLGMKGGVAE